MSSLYYILSSVPFFFPILCILITWSTCPEGTVSLLLTTSITDACLLLVGFPHNIFSKQKNINKDNITWSYSLHHGDEQKMILWSTIHEQVNINTVESVITLNNDIHCYIINDNVLQHSYLQQLFITWLLYDIIHLCYNVCRSP